MSARKVRVHHHDYQPVDEGIEVHIAKSLGVNR